MCGIIGIFNAENSYDIAKNGLKLMEYRGFDASNVIKIDNGSIGHCLHAIVDKVEQPIGNKNYLVCNSEIYNWQELNEKFKLDCRNDAELLFVLLERFGVEKTLELIDGDYACAYYRDEKVYLFRDLIGVKPLWFAKNFAFCSEKKVLEKLQYKDIEDLNPRKILVYDGKIKFIDRKFYSIGETSDNYEDVKLKVKELLINAVKKRIPECKFGLLFSGGVDSLTIAKILKDFGVKFKCYICVLDEENLKEAKDLDNAIKAAKELSLDLEVVKVKLKDVKENIPKVVNLIESSNVTKVGVALPFYFASKRAKEDGCKVLLSGLGSDEIFGGYNRHHGGDVNKECYSKLLWLYENDLYRDDAIMMSNNIELRVPYLDSKLIEYSLSISGKYKLNEENKFVLRDLRLLRKEFAFRKKTAAQYGSNFDKAIDKLSRLNNCKSKSEYLNQFYNKPNVKLGVLFSGGKDSCYAMHIMKRQNYSIECLISIKSKNKDSFMFHTPNIDLVKYQAEALEIPLVSIESEGEKEYELKDLEKALEEAKKMYGIQGVVTGALFSIYQRDRIEKVCDNLGLKVFSPLWHKKQDQELKEIINEGFEVIIVSVAADGLGEKWLGRKIDEETILELEKLNNKVGLNVAFEGGEAETFVLNAPMFKSRIEIKNAEKIMYNTYSGIYNIREVELAKRKNFSEDNVIKEILKR